MYTERQENEKPKRYGAAQERTVKEQTEPEEAEEATQPPMLSRLPPTLEAARPTAFSQTHLLHCTQPWMAESHSAHMASFSLVLIFKST